MHLLIRPSFHEDILVARKKLPMDSLLGTANPWAWRLIPADQLGLQDVSVKKAWLMLRETPSRTSLPAKTNITLGIPMPREQTA